MNQTGSTYLVSILTTDWEKVRRFSIVDFTSRKMTPFLINLEDHYTNPRFYPMQDTDIGIEDVEATYASIKRVTLLGIYPIDLNLPLREQFPELTLLSKGDS